MLKLHNHKIVTDQLSHSKIKKVSLFLGRKNWTMKTKVTNATMVL